MEPKLAASSILGFYAELKKPYLVPGQYIVQMRGILILSFNFGQQSGRQIFPKMWTLMKQKYV